jgi:hypothetical protein
VKKTVRWFRMTPLELAGETDGEVDEVAWVPVGEALGRLTHGTDRDHLKQVTGSGAADAR